MKVHGNKAQQMKNRNKVLIPYMKFIISLEGRLKMKIKVTTKLTQYKVIPRCLLPG